MGDLNFSMFDENPEHIIKWHGAVIDINDSRLLKFVIFVDKFGKLCIMNRHNFKIIKLEYEDDKIKLYDELNNLSCIFEGFDFFFRQLIQDNIGE